MPYICLATYILQRNFICIVVSILHVRKQVITAFSKSHGQEAKPKTSNLKLFPFSRNAVSPAFQKENRRVGW